MEVWIESREHRTIGVKIHFQHDRLVFVIGYFLEHDVNAINSSRVFTLECSGWNCGVIRYTLDHLPNGGMRFHHEVIPLHLEILAFLTN